MIYEITICRLPDFLAVRDPVVHKNALFIYCNTLLSLHAPRGCSPKVDKEYLLNFKLFINWFLSKDRNPWKYFWLLAFVFFDSNCYDLSTCG